MHIFGSTVSKGIKFAQGDFSADGRWLLFMNLSFNNSQVKAIERVPAHGGTPEIVPTTGQVEEFHCSIQPKGRCVLREIDGNNHLIFYALDPVLGMGTELARIPWQPTILGDWSISPDGATIAMANHDPAHPGVQLVPLARESSKDDHGSVRQIPVVGFGTVLDANWSSDGQRFFVETYAAPGYDLLSADLEGHLALLRTSHDLIWAVPSPDGKRIAFPALGPAKRNVWIGAVNPAALR
jgi:hypothetical protein